MKKSVILIASVCALIIISLTAFALMVFEKDKEAQADIRKTPIMSEWGTLVKLNENGQLVEILNDGTEQRALFPRFSQKRKKTDRPSFKELCGIKVGMSSDELIRKYGLPDRAIGYFGVDSIACSYLSKEGKELYIVFQDLNHRFDYAEDGSYVIKDVYGIGKKAFREYLIAQGIDPDTVEYTSEDKNQDNPKETTTALPENITDGTLETAYLPDETETDPPTDN